MKTSLLKAIQISFFPVLCFTVLFWSGSAWSYSPSESYDEVNQAIQERIYVTPEQIEVTEDGILVYNIAGEEPIVGKTLSYDEKGLYLIPLTLRGPCGVHNLWCKHCKGCGVIYCPMKCECPFGGGG